MVLPHVTCITALMLFAFVSPGCPTKTYRFKYPSEDRPVTSSFIAVSPLGSAVSRVSLYTVDDDNGRTRPGVFCYVPTSIEPVYDSDGPKVWKRVSGKRVEYSIIASPVISRDDYKTVRDALAIANPNLGVTLVPCDLFVNEVQVPGTLASTRVFINKVSRVSGDMLWFVRIECAKSLEGQIESLMKSNTGLLVPTRATLRGINLAISPPFEIHAITLERENELIPRQ